MGFRNRLQKVVTGQVPLGVPMRKMRLINKTASYTVLRGESGSMFTTRGAGVAVQFTLPALEDGLFFYFFCAANQNLNVAAAVAGEVIAFNDDTANIVHYNTLNEKVGGGFLLICDGTKWHAFAMSYGLGATAQTVSIST